MPSPDYYLKSGDASFLKVYEKYARDVAVLFGASQERAQTEIHKVVELEVKLANVSRVTGAGETWVGGCREAGCRGDVGGCRGAGAGGT